MTLSASRPAWLSDLLCALAAAAVVVLFAIFVLSVSSESRGGLGHARTGAGGAQGFHQR